MRFAKHDEIVRQAKIGEAIKVSIAGAHDIDVLKAVKQAEHLGLIEPIFVGNATVAKELAKDIEFDIDRFIIHDTKDEEETAYIAAKLADEGLVKIVMKGFINSTPFLKAVLHKDFQLRTGNILSHLAAFEIPGYEFLLFMTDGGLNIAPNMLQKEQILINAIQFLRLIELETPKVAILAANERVSKSMPVTIEAQELVKLAKTGRFGSVIMEGPLPLDLAINNHSIIHKGIESEIGGTSDLLVVPSIEAGNIFGKSITYFAKGIMAGVVLGAKVPLILNSRSDSAEAKLASIALSVLAVKRGYDQKIIGGI